MLATLTDNTPHRLTARIYVASDGTQHVTRALEQSWTDDELAAVGLHRIHRESVPEGHVETGRALIVEDGQVVSRPTSEPRTVTAEDVRAERDRRLALPFEFEGAIYDRDPISLQRIAGAAQIAALAVASGAEPGDYYWHGGEAPFGWITVDDDVTPMDAATVVEFGKAAAARETALVFAARALRRMEPIPADYADDKWWP